MYPLEDLREGKLLQMGKIQTTQRREDCTAIGFEMVGLASSVWEAIMEKIKNSPVME